MENVKIEKDKRRRKSRKEERGKIPKGVRTKKQRCTRKRGGQIYPDNKKLCHSFNLRAELYLRLTNKHML